MAEDEINNLMNDSDSEDEEENAQLRRAFLARFLRTVMYDPQVMNRNEDLIRSLKENGALTDDRVEQAMLLIPREYFVTPDLRIEAYHDNPLRFSKMAFNISAPHMHAMCLCKMDIKPGNIVLDIGSGSGILTALAGFLTGPTGEVHGLDLYDHIIEFSTKNIANYLADKGHQHNITLNHVKFFKRNCFIPSTNETKYDRIHVGACCPESHLQTLYDLLKPGGIIVTPFGDRLIKSTKAEEGFLVENLVSVRYTDLILPSDAEIKEAQKAIAIAKASVITIPPSSIISQFSLLLSNQQSSDIVLIVEGNKIYAHKLLLKIRSQILNGVDPKQSELQIQNCSYDMFMNILSYIYTDTCNTIENTEELLKFSKHFGVEQLVSKLELKEFHSLVRDLEKLINNQLYHDVTMLVEEKSIPAHKLILETRSEHFLKVFSSGLKESQSNQVLITDCTAEVFLDVLRFIYTDDCNVVESNCISLLEQANFFQLDRLKAICESFWFNNININNAGSVLEVADRFNATQLKDFAMEFIFKNIKDVVKTPAFLGLDQDLISSILIASVERGK